MHKCVNIVVMFDGRIAASKIIKITTQELELRELVRCREGRFAIRDKCLIYHPKNYEEAMTVLEAYNQLRESPLIKALS